MEQVEASAVNGSSEVTIRNNNKKVVNGDVTLGELNLRYGGKIEINGDLRTEGNIKLSRSCELIVNGNLRVGGDTIRSTRNSTVIVNNGSVISQSLQNVDISRGSKFKIPQGQFKCQNANVKLSRNNSRIEVGQTSNFKNLRFSFVSSAEFRGTVNVGTVNLSNSATLIVDGVLSAKTLQGASRAEVQANEIIADTNSNSSVNNIGKYVSDDSEEDDEEDLFDVSKDPVESVDVNDVNPDISNDDLVVWMDARIMYVNDMADFPFEDFDRVVKLYPKLRNILGSISNARDAIQIAENNSNISLSQYQKEKLQRTQEVAEHSNEDSTEILREIAQVIPEYDESQLPQDQLTDEENQSSISDYAEQEDEEYEDDFSAFDEF